MATLNLFILVLMAINLSGVVPHPLVLQPRNDDAKARRTEWPDDSVVRILRSDTGLAESMVRILREQRSLPKEFLRILRSNDKNGFDKDEKEVTEGLVRILKRLPLRRFLLQDARARFRAPHVANEECGQLTY